jgi:hypothetical protein
MKFYRYIRAERRPITGRRLAAARRALQRQTDAVALFPDLQPTETPEQRCNRFDDENLARVQDWRDTRAANWKRARKTLRALTAEQQAQVDRRFTQNRFMPGDPVYLLEIIRSVLKGVTP